MAKRYQVKNFDGSVPFDPKIQYDHRIEFLTKQLERGIKSGKYLPSRSKAVLAGEKASYLADIEEMKTLDRINGDVAIVIPTYWRQKPWLRACLESCKKTGLYILLAYDNHFWASDDLFPTPDIMAMADSVVIKHRTYFASVGISHMWNMFYNLQLLHEFGFPYIFSIAGDCIMETPENFNQLMDLLGDNDALCNYYDEKRGYAGTLGVLAKTEVYLGYFEDFIRNQYDGSGSTEGRWFKYLKDNNFKVAPVKNNAHNFKMPDHNSDWNRILGFRHLHPEQVIRREERLYPVEKEYYDFGPNNKYLKENTSLYKFYETGDIKYLKEWWGELK